jgi:carbonic anhydrase/acetyltransferase-like protein (isoleucine patch superfamily)
MAIRPFSNSHPNINATAWIDDSSLIIGDVTLGADSSIWPMAVVRGDVNSISIGQRTNIQDGSIIHVTHRGQHHPEGFATILGDEVTVGHQVVLHGCTISNRCLIGMKCCIMDGAVLEPQVLLGAGSLVTPNKVLRGGYLWMGSPARCIRELTEEELDFFAYSAEHYVKLKNQYQKN